MSGLSGQGRPPGLPGRRGSATLGQRGARAAVLGALRHGGPGRIAVLEDGRAEPVVQPGPGREAVTVTVHDPATYPALLREGSVGFGRSYAAGWWDADDLVELVRLATRRLPPPNGAVARWRSAVAGAWQRGGGRRDSAPVRRRPEARAEVLDRARQDVQAHYDLGDEFFGLFLDPTLTYSCGLFESPSTTLEEASVAKLDRLCRKLGLRPGDEVLEIGTGWGSFALHAAARYGCRVTTTTISDRQFDRARRRVADAGLGHLVTVLRRDFRELEGAFHRVVSVEMIEALDWRDHPAFFTACARLLRPDGLLGLQAIVIDDRLYEAAKRSRDFIKAMVFPGSCIPSVASITATVAGATDLRVVDLEDIGRHYAETLRRWRVGFTEQRVRAAELGFDRSFLRLWDLYLAYCEAGFLERRISDVQMVLAKPGWEPAWPGVGLR